MFALLGVEFPFSCNVFKQFLSNGNGFVNCLGESLSRFVLAKKLFANEEHSYAEAIAGDVFVMPLAGADFLAILNGIATQRHSRAIAISLLFFVFAEAFLDFLDHFRHRKEFVWAF